MQSATAAATAATRSVRRGKRGTGGRRQRRGRQAPEGPPMAARRVGMGGDTEKGGSGRCGERRRRGQSPQRWGRAGAGGGAGDALFYGGPGVVWGETVGLPSGGSRRHAVGRSPEARDGAGRGGGGGGLQARGPPPPTSRGGGGPRRGAARLTNTPPLRNRQPGRAGRVGAAPPQCPPRRRHLGTTWRPGS